MADPATHTHLPHVHWAPLGLTAGLVVAVVAAILTIGP
jgi:hypothetical protein